jgi:hypothetical protein
MLHRFLSPRPGTAGRVGAEAKWIVVAAAAAWLAGMVGVAQPSAPHIGYVYPAGGRPGTSFEITVGGQFLAGMSNAIATIPGAAFTFIEFSRPMPQNEFNRLRDRLKELQDKRQASRRSGGSTNAFSAADAREITEIQGRIVKNPPNRQGNPALAETVRLKVTVPPGVRPDEHEVRLIGPSGLSNPLVFRVDDLPEYTAPPSRSPNPDRDRVLERLGRKPTPQVSEHLVELPIILNGQVMPGTVDRFRFAARKGDRLVAAATARGLIPYIPDAVPGWFQAVLTLRDLTGHEIAYNDDFRASPDPLLSCLIPRDGYYVLEIKDSIYRGREDFVYRIALGQLPYVTSAFPLGAQAGQEVQVQLQGWNLPTNAVSRVSLETPGTHARLLLDGSPVHHPVLLQADTLPEAVEVEPNHAPAEAQSVALPLIINGRIENARDVDRFRFAGHAGEEVVAEVMARRLGSPLDSVLRITDAAGKVLATNDDHEDPAAGLNTHHADSWLRCRLPSDGTYVVQLADAQRQGGSEFAYRLRLSGPRPGFELRVVPSSIQARGGLPVPLSVHALRRDGFVGEIDLSLDGAPTGSSLQGGRIAAGQDRVRMTLVMPPLSSSGPVALQVVGSALIDGRRVEQLAAPADDRMQAFAYRHLVTARELWVCVTGRSFLGLPLRGGQRATTQIPVGGSGRFRVAVPPGLLGRRFELELDDPPEGLTLEKIVPLRDAVELVVRSDAAKSKAGLEGNLIVSIVPMDGAGGARRPQRAAGARRLPVGALPALPFEVVAARD